jgi:hypothetical protein
VALGIATMVAVLGVSGSSRAQLVAQIDALGTNLLTVAPGQAFGGQTVTLPPSAPAMVARIGPVIGAAAIGDVNAQVYRNDRISAANTNAITVYSADADLLRTLQGQLARGRFLDAATARYPAVVLGRDAATALGIDRTGVQVWLGHRWFGVIGIMRPLPLAPELDRTALIGYPVARRLLHATARRCRSTCGPTRPISPRWPPSGRPPPIRRRRRTCRWPTRSPRSPPGPTPRSRSRNCFWRWVRWRCWSAASASPT